MISNASFLYPNRMSSLAKNGVLAFLAVGCGLALSAKPWILARAESATARDKLRQAEADESRMVRDRTQEGRLNTELGKEEAVRERGYHRIGERPVPE